jgi:hypothetical protein
LREPNDEFDPKEVQVARAQELATIKRWIKEYMDPVTTAI